MLTPPEAEACCARWKLLLLLLLLPVPVPMPLEPAPGDSSASSRLRLLRPERPAVDTLLLLLLDVARDTAIRDDGLGVSFSLWGGGDRRPDTLASPLRGGRGASRPAPPPPLPPGPAPSRARPPLLLALQELAVGADLHVQRQLDVEQLLVLGQLLLHHVPHLGHLLLLGVQHLAELVPLPSHGLLELANPVLCGTGLAGGGVRAARSGRPLRVRQRSAPGCGALPRLLRTRAATDGGQEALVGWGQGAPEAGGPYSPAEGRGAASPTLPFRLVYTRRRESPASGGQTAGS